MFPRLVVGALVVLGALDAFATPSHKAAMERHYDRFLAKNLNRCTPCHLPSAAKEPESLDDFPHNAFGDRLRVLGEEFEKAGRSKDIATRLASVAREDSDGDGFDNESELLAGANPGDAKDFPVAAQLADAKERAAEFGKFLASYHWRPFERVARPALPPGKNSEWVRTPIDGFIAAEHAARGLKPRPSAPKTILLRRVYLDLIGLSPTPEEQRVFDEDGSPDAYEKIVDRLLADPRYGERWGRHWMDVWRYSDWAGWTDGKQVRDSQRHIWRWRDWIVESLNADHGYDRMVTEMLAADELAPEDTGTLRATGFLVRNFKMLSREQWLEDTVKHTAQAFLGITLGCAKCHDHRTDPISQAEYYQVRAIFEPHQVRTDRVRGELDREKDGLPRVYDVAQETPTYFLIRGDERKPDKDRVMPPGVPKALCGDRLAPSLAIAPVALPRDAAAPDRRGFVIEDTIAASEQDVAKARAALEKEKSDASRKEFEIAEAKHDALLAVIRAERIEDDGRKDTAEWKEAATFAERKQANLAVLDARLAFEKATAAAKKTAEAAKALAKAEEQMNAVPTTTFKPRPKDDYPAQSTGRRLAFARWIASADNPLTARVAMNHLWLRHFGRGIVTTPENFGTNGARPSHPALLDWLAAEFMETGWKMKPMHRMIVTSSTYRMASTPDEANAQRDPDNPGLWRMPARRMEAELVRDNLLHVSGALDLTRGGPDIDHAQGLTSKRRSIYLRTAAEREVEFLKIFDGPSVTDCYQRHQTVMPQQSLALANSELTIERSKELARTLGDGAAEDFVRSAFQRVLARVPTIQEMTACGAFLNRSGSDPARCRENLILVLFNHNDFVTIR